jgi:hypothetical protein
MLFESAAAYPSLAMMGHLTLASRTLERLDACRVPLALARNLVYIGGRRARQVQASPFTRRTGPEARPIIGTFTVIHTLIT